MQKKMLWLLSWVYHKCVGWYEPESLLRKQMKYVMLQFINYLKNM
ncbi:MAG: hypothetical protein RLZZ500_486 [Bacteroidota bacterium]|jgi:hypothetical protein